MRLKQERHQARLAEKVSMITASLSLQVADFRYIPAVTDQWLPQYERIRSRYKFLVLNGPSGTGKTYFAKHILRVLLPMGEARVLRCLCVLCNSYVGPRGFYVYINFN